MSRSTPIDELPGPREELIPETKQTRFQEEDDIQVQPNITAEVKPKQSQSEPMPQGNKVIKSSALSIVELLTMTALFVFVSMFLVPEKVSYLKKLAPSRTIQLVLQGAVFALLFLVVNAYVLPKVI